MNRAGFKKLAVLTSFLMLSFAAAAAVKLPASETADNYFNRGLENYLSGELDRAIENIEKALDYTDEDEKMTAFLLRVLAERASELYGEGEYTESLSYLEKILLYEPDNRDALQMKEIIKSRLEEDPPPELAERETETIAVLLGSIQRQQEDLIEARTFPTDMFLRALQASEKEREELLETIRRQQRDQRHAYYVSVGAVIAAVVLTALLIYFILMKLSSRREDMLLRQQERMLDMVTSRRDALAQGRTQLKLPHGVTAEETMTARQMLNAPNPRVRSKGLEIVDTELVEEGDAEVAKRLLQPFIDEKDNRVRATALKILHRYNPSRAMSKLREMIEGADKWMRVSAAWALGEIKPGPESAELLMKNFSKEDRHFKRRIIMSLKNILEKGQDELDGETVDKIQEFLEHNKSPAEEK